MERTVERIRGGGGGQEKVGLVVTARVSLVFFLGGRACRNVHRRARSREASQTEEESKRREAAKSPVREEQEEVKRWSLGGKLGCMVWGVEVRTEGGKEGEGNVECGEVAWLRD